MDDGGATGVRFRFVATAIWMVSRIIPAEAGLALWALFAIGLAVWLGAFDTLGPDAGGRRRTAKAAGLAAALYGIALGLGAASGGNDPLRPLGNLVAQRGGSGAGEELSFRTAGTSAELQTQIAASDAKPSLLYVTADWCVTCAVIDRSVFPDPAVQADLNRFNLIKLDVSGNTPAQQQIMRSLQVVGPPTMILSTNKDARQREPDWSATSPRRPCELPSKDGDRAMNAVSIGPFVLPRTSSRLYSGYSPSPS